MGNNAHFKVTAGGKEIPIPEGYNSNFQECVTGFKLMMAKTETRDLTLVPEKRDLMTLLYFNSQGEEIFRIESDTEWVPNVDMAKVGRELIKTGKVGKTLIHTS